jgi:hypothetical protein
LRLELSDFNELTGNSDRRAWGVGIARIDLATMRLSAPSAAPIIMAAHLGDDVAFVADPFRIAAGGRTYVFTEAWSRSARRGRIAVVTLNGNREVTDSAVVLDEPFHLSYPCVFRMGDDYYMLPEAWESGQLTLYRAQSFPFEWERVKSLLELDYADPQIFFDEGLWYLFLNTDPLANVRSSLFWAESPLATWHAHPLNPIISGDARCARSAGPLFRYGGRTFRFTQDCEAYYGSGVIASEIVELSPVSFRTRLIGPVMMDRPRWARDAFHHLDLFIQDGTHYALFDGCTFDDPPLQQAAAELE